MYRSFYTAALVWVTLMLFPAPLQAKPDESIDVTMDLWRSVDTFDKLQACAGIDPDGNLMLIEYDVVHFLPSAPGAADGGVRVRPRLKTRSLDGARIQTIAGQALSLEAFGNAFKTRPANASRTEEGSNVREHHALVLLLEHNFEAGKHRKTPSHYRQIFRPDLPVISLPRAKSKSTKIRGGSIRP